MLLENHHRLLLLTQKIGLMTEKSIISEKLLDPKVIPHPSHNLRQLCDQFAFVLFSMHKVFNFFRAGF